MFKGTGNVKLTMYIVAPSDQSGDMFQVYTAGGTGNDDNTGGLTFEDLTFVYQTISSENIWWSAIHTIPTSPGSEGGGAENVRVVRCVFVDCPIGIWFEVAFQPSVLHSTFHWISNTGIGVMLGDGGNGAGAAKQVAISGCHFEAVSKTGPVNQTAIQIGGCDHARVTDCEIDSVTYGIMITPGTGPGAPTSAGTIPSPNALHLSFVGVNVYVGVDSANTIGNGCKIQPYSTDQAIGQVVFLGCTFEMGEQAAPTTGGPGILVNAMDPSNEQCVIDSVRFVSCYSCQWPGPGLSIIGGPTNVEVEGGQYAGNKYESINTQYYGIYVGEAIGVRIANVACVGIYRIVLITAAPNNSPQQAVGIYIDDGASDVLVSNCDVRRNSDAGIQINGGASDVIIGQCDARETSMTNGIVVDAGAAAVTDVLICGCDVTGYTGGYADAINVTGSALSTLRITDCAGYNDQSVPLSFLASSGTVTFHGYGEGYFGPISFFVHAGGSQTVATIKIGSVTTGLSSGAFSLPQSQSATVVYTPITSFLTIPAVGQ
jgi:hypothetical protein